MDATLIRSLQDKAYDKRKAASFQLEGLIKDAVLRSEPRRVTDILIQLETLATNSNSTWRYGGVMGLAASSIALSNNIAPYLYHIVPPILSCFSDPDSKLRYFSCESMYNVAKVAKGEILVYFNGLFDTLSKLAADPDPAVMNGAELLDRLIKDIVSEQAATYYVDTPTDGKESTHSDSEPEQTLAFSLPRFIPLLRERIYNYNPWTRQFLVSWLLLLDSIPELDLISYLPEFLDGLIKYLADSGTDVLVSVQNLLADFLREIGEVAAVQRAKEREYRRRVEERARAEEIRRGKQPEGADGPTEPEEEVPEESLERGDDESSGYGAGAWVPGQGVQIDHGAVVQILVSWLSIPGVVEEIQVVCLRWLAELVQVVPDVIIPFTPQLIPLILGCLPHHSPAIRLAAEETNQNLYRAIAQLPSSSPPPTADDTKSTKDKTTGSPPMMSVPKELAPRQNGDSVSNLALEASKISLDSEELPPDLLDYGSTVNALTLQFLNENEETRLAALEWLLVLHAKVPDKILSLEDGTFPALLKTLSDPAEQVIRLDLQLLSQISSRSTEDGYFFHFMTNLLGLFTTDRGLLEQRGSLIIRQLCLHLNGDRIYKTLGEILEKDEDLEFASSMVQNLGLIMITSPELADFRKRLKNLETKDGQALFVNLYRSFSHNAVATFTLCLLAQAYEHACNLLPVFAELETTMPLFVQIDKLVQLLESPIFTSLRLQLLEPERYPYLYKALYGILMLLPQSTAFTTLRARLGSVSNLGFLHAVPRASYTNPTPAPRRRTDDIPWPALLAHFRSVQMKHERLRRQSAAGGSISGAIDSGSSNGGFGGASPLGIPGAKRKPPAAASEKSMRGRWSALGAGAGGRTSPGGASKAGRLPSVRR